mmetsp:Transcript_15522/g.21778  ORF Transcript_15522/g.21778 Transcript_15522/m.21778 type:complete len:93 (+) Transcript_15522:50-328(+)
MARHAHINFVDPCDESIARAICALVRAKTQPKDFQNILNTMRLGTTFENFKLSFSMKISPYRFCSNLVQSRRFHLKSVRAARKLAASVRRLF